MGGTVSRDEKIECWMAEQELRAREALERRINQLERLNATLAAEIDKQRAEHNAEVDEFNAGYEAAQQGLPESSEPSDTKYDVWKCGYAWGAFEKLKAEIDLLRPIIEACQLAKRNGLIGPNSGFTVSKIYHAVVAYEAAKERG